MKKTEWFLGQVKPVHIGVYEVQNPIKTDFRWSYWNGNFWGLLAPDKEAAVCLHCHARYNQEAPWRGLVSPQDE